MARLKSSYDFFTSSMWKYQDDDDGDDESYEVAKKSSSLHCSQTRVRDAMFSVQITPLRTISEKISHFLLGLTGRNPPQVVLSLMAESRSAANGCVRVCLLQTQALLLLQLAWILISMVLNNLFRLPRYTLLHEDFFFRSFSWVNDNSLMGFWKLTSPSQKYFLCGKFSIKVYLDVCWGMLYFNYNIKKIKLSTSKFRL